MSLKFIREKGFIKPNGILRREIFLKGWTDLYKHPKASVAPIIHEFYANMCGEQDGEVFVRG